MSALTFPLCIGAAVVMPLLFTTWLNARWADGVLPAQLMMLGVIPYVTHYALSAALLGIDACPMEGFDRAQYDEILGLNAQGYASAVIATVGYRAETDPSANAPKVRFPKEQIFAHV